MKTKLLKPSKNSIKLACKLLKAGEVVALPTETVYGLAGDAKNPIAIKKIFEAKGRPQDNPLIVHISNFQMLDSIVSKIPEKAKILMEHFWPGPLTIIFSKGNGVCNETCAGLDSVGVRMPSNKIARKIIEKSGIAFAAPSANISGRPSPTNAQDVYDDMNSKIPLIIDGGNSDAGVESTVVSCLENTPIILRPGVITQKMMEKVLNCEVKIAKAITEDINNEEKVLSPGMKYKHYSPKANVFLVKGSFEKFRTFVEEQNNNGLFALVFDGEDKKIKTKAICYGKENDSSSQAHNLFAKFRELDKLGAKTVYVRCPKSEGVGLAVYNRLIRSAGFKIIEV